MYEDAKAIRLELERLIEDQGKDVIVVMHSYGGVVGTEAVKESLRKKARQSKDLPGGVLELLYLCAFLPKLGDSLTSALGGQLPPFIPIEADGSCNMLEPDRRFYNDLPQDAKDHWVSELRPHPAGAQMTPLTYVAYKYHPTTYLYCTEDQALPIPIQQMMVAGAGADFKTETCNSGHSPFLSQPETVNEIVKKMTA